MNTTPSSAPTLLPSLRRLHRLAAGGALALVLLGATAGLAAPADAAGKVSYSDLSRKVNEYEGQHRRAGDPSQWGVVSGKDPEMPVSPNVARKVNEYEGQHR